MGRSYISYVQLVDIVGETDANALCQRFGGQAVYIGKKPEKSPLHGVISPCAVESLCGEFRAEELQLPMGPRRKPTVKEVIGPMLERGMSTAQIAEELGVTSRCVQIARRDVGRPTPKRVAAPRPRPEPKPRGRKREILDQLRNNQENLSVRQIAEKFGVSPEHIYHLRAEYQIPPYRGRTAQAGNA